MLTYFNPHTIREIYFDIIGGKTASLFSACCEAASVISGATSDEIERLKSFGFNFGMAFQIIDDMLDYTASQSTSGKQVGKDFFEGKVTLPAIIVYEKSSTVEREFREKCFSSAERDFDQALYYINARHQMKQFRMPHYAIAERDKEAIEKLRKAVKNELTPYYDTDFNLLRWLQGHNYNFDVVISRLKNHLLLRNSWDLDHLASKPRNHPLHTYWKAGLTGPAIKTPNVIVNVEQTGRNDYWGMIQTFSSSEIMLARTHDLELFLRRIMEMEERTGQQAFIMYIMDLTDLKYDKRLLSLMTGPLASMSTFMSEHYIEMINKFALVNVPPFMATIWAFVKPLLPERTRQKVSIFGSNWKHEIQNLAVPEVLPAYWNDDKIKMGLKLYHYDVILRNFLNKCLLLEKLQVFKAELDRARPLDPQQYYKKELDERSKVLSIGAGKTGTIDVNAEKGSVIRLCFHADGHFAFTIFYVNDQSYENSNSSINIYPIMTKVPGPTTVPIKDEIKCDKSGTYKIWFSNEHAWLHTLNIHYLIDVKSDNE